MAPPFGPLPRASPSIPSSRSRILYRTILNAGFYHALAHSRLYGPVDLVDLVDPMANGDARRGEAGRDEREVRRGETRQDEA